MRCAWPKGSQASRASRLDLETPRQSQNSEFEVRAGDEREIGETPLSKKIVFGCGVVLVTLVSTTVSAYSAFLGLTGCSPSAPQQSCVVGTLTGCNSSPPAPAVNPTASATLNCNPS